MLMVMLHIFYQTKMSLQFLWDAIYIVANVEDSNVVNHVVTRAVYTFTICSRFLSLKQANVDIEEEYT